MSEVTRDVFCQQFYHELHGMVLDALIRGATGTMPRGFLADTRVWLHGLLGRLHGAVGQSPGLSLETLQREFRPLFFGLIAEALALTDQGAARSRFLEGVRSKLREQLLLLWNELKKPAPTPLPTRQPSSKVSAS